MFCGKCGTPIEDGAVSCSNCGAAVTSAPASDGIVAPKGKTTINFKDPKVLGVLAVVAVILVFFLFGGRSYKSAVNDFMDGVLDANGSKILKCIPDKLIDEAMDESGMSKKEMGNYLADNLGSMFEYLDRYFDDWSISYKITGTEKYDSDDLADIKEDYKDEYGVRVKDAMIVKIELTIKADGNKESQTMDLGVIKVGGSWYVDVENGGSFF